jgi:predicted transposase YbfD/YdcC
MDAAQDTTFVQFLSQVPDPRHARGKRHAWSVILTVISAAVAAGCTTPHAIAQWTALHASVLQSSLCPGTRRLPSESTLVRALRSIDVSALEAEIAHLAAETTRRTPQATITCPNGERLDGQAIDGKAVRGAARQGQPTHLVSLVHHGSGTTLAQRAVATKRNEIKAVPLLLATRDLTDTVITMDALLTQRKLARQIQRQHGHYLMIVKRNQPQLYEALERWFLIPTLPADDAQEDQVRTVSKGHGRLEIRTLECSTGLTGYLTWPGVRQIIRRTCERTVLKTGKTSREVTYGVTDLTPRQAGAAQLEQLWRAHWTIENRSHYVRDVTLGEDRGQAHTGSTAQALAAWRNGVVGLLRQAGWQNIADAVRAYAASVHAALGLVGARSHAL